MLAQYFIFVFIFCVVLFLYLHITYHLKCGNDLEVYTIDIALSNRYVEYYMKPNHHKKKSYWYCL